MKTGLWGSPLQSKDQNSSELFQYTTFLYEHQPLARTVLRERRKMDLNFLLRNYYVARDRDLARVLTLPLPVHYLNNASSDKTA